VCTANAEQPVTPAALPAFLPPSRWPLSYRRRHCQTRGRRKVRPVPPNNRQARRGRKPPSQPLQQTRAQARQARLSVYLVGPGRACVCARYQTAACGTPLGCVCARLELQPDDAALAGNTLRLRRLKLFVVRLGLVSPIGPPLRPGLSRAARGGSRKAQCRSRGCQVRAKCVHMHY
jgi:hypothetical protein